MQVFTIFLALMASSVLAVPIGRYRDPVLRPRNAQQKRVPYSNSTTSAQTSTSSGVLSEFLVILPSTDSILTTQTPTFHNVDGATTNVASSTAVDPSASVPSANLPVKTTNAPLNSDAVTSSTSSRSFEHIGDAPKSTSLAAAPIETVTSTVSSLPTPSSGITTSSVVITGSTSDAVVTPSPTSVSTQIDGTLSTQHHQHTSAPLFSSVRFPVGTSKPIATSVAATTSVAVTPAPIATSVAVTTSAVVVTSATIVTSIPTTSVKPTVATSVASYTSASAVPGNGTGGGAGDKFGNKQLAITANKNFSTLTIASKCNADDSSTQNACINGQWAQCDNGIYVITACDPPTKCFAMPLELSPGTGVGCTTPDDAAYRMGLGSAAELQSLIAGGSAGGSVGNGTSTGLSRRSVTSAAGTADSTSLPPQEPQLPLPTYLTRVGGCVSSVQTPTASAVDTALDTPLPTETMPAAPLTPPQEPTLPLPTYIVLPPGSGVTPVPVPSVTSEPASYVSEITVTATVVATTVRVEG